MNKAIIAVIAILLVVSMSGCTMPFSGSDAAGVAGSVGIGYPGVEFTTFYPVNTKVLKGSNVELYFAVQNNGYFDAENVNVSIYNCGDIKEGTHTWPVKLKGHENDPFYYSCNVAVQAPPDGRLKMPDRVQGVEGQMADAEIILGTSKANFPVGESPQTFNARLTYDYQATANRDVAFTTFDNWKEKGGNIQTGVLMSSTKPAPISVSINAPSEALIITKDGNNKDQPQLFTIAVQVQNTGGGYLKDKQLNFIELCYDTALVTLADPAAEPMDFAPCSPLPTDAKINTVDACCSWVSRSSNCICVPTGSNITYPVSPQKLTTYGMASKITVDSKLNMIGLTNQWRNVVAVFNTSVDKNGVAAVQVQDVANFDTTTKFTYMSDTSTLLTLMRPK